MKLNEWKDIAFNVARDHGFFDVEYTDKHWLMLIVCEMAEVVEADRGDRHADADTFDKTVNDCGLRVLSFEQIPNSRRTDYWFTVDAFMIAFERFVKDTVEDELADVFIRCLSLAGLKDIDLEALDDAWNNVEYKLDTFVYVPDCLDIVAIPEVMFECCTFVTEENDVDMKIMSVMMGVMSYCRLMNIDLFWHVDRKLRYNNLRPMLNGKRY